EESASQPVPAGPKLIEDYPHLIKAQTRFFNMQSPSLTVRYEENSFNEQRFFFADSSVFNIFSYRFITGDPKTALKDPNSIVITEETAKKYFNEEDPIGKTLLFQGGASFQVTGVLENVPPQTHLRFDFLASFGSLNSIMGQNFNRNWYWNPCWTYVLVQDNIEPEQLEEILPDFVENYPQFIQDKITLHLQPLEDIHLHSNLDYEVTVNSDVTYIYIFLAIAVFVMVIACMNFMNLSTARSITRMKEIGMRKVLGAYRHQLIKQFLGESVLLSLLSMMIAVITVELLLPSFNNFTGKEMALDYMSNTFLIAAMTCITLFVGMVSGIYPALFLSGFKPVVVLKSTLRKGEKSALLRKGLVVLQFSISIILIAGTITAVMQLDYLQNTNLGFEKEEIILIPFPPGTLARNFPALTERLKQNPDIQNVTAIEGKPGIFTQTGTYSPEGYTERAQLQIPRLIVDFDFIETFGMEMVAGRSFTREFAADTITGLIINEAAAEFLGWSPEESINKIFQRGSQIRIVGVVKDFHYASLHNEIGPFLFDLTSSLGQFNFFMKYVAVRFNTQNVGNIISYVESTWNEVIPNQPFEYLFMDEELDEQYAAEVKLGILSKIFSSLAVFIACLGLYALASLTAQQKIREIGIRKVLGATVPNLLVLMSREFTNLVLISNLIGLPASYYFINKWLNNFAYRIDMGWDIFVVSGISAFLIALVTVSYHSFRAATTNPSSTLQNE
ncbi:MAG: FtsX-like permease family protein, partial [bacterium]|nr:FtsX-like permease family protein [bacterium]